MGMGSKVYNDWVSAADAALLYCIKKRDRLCQVFFAQKIVSSDCVKRYSLCVNNKASLLTFSRACSTI